ncbi:MAG: phosphatidylglycerol lysyltransferase domain-containing protein [Methanolinea sp.]|nr:phosphatidylglycerol lysyltransferase domain-containing protein [Methanolinea sp.]
MLKFSHFKPVTMGEKDLFSAHYARFPPVHSDNLFSNMVCWNHFAHYSYVEKKGCLIISSTINGKTSFRPPTGPRDPDLLHDLLVLAVREGDENPLVLVDQESCEWIRSLYPGVPLHPDRNYWEYVYLTSDLAHLPGQKYQNIRRQLNRFRSRCHPEVEEISRENIPDIRAFLLEWCEWKQCDEHPFLSYEKDAVMFAIDHFHDLGLSGLVIRAEEKVGAIAVFEELNAGTAVVHFEKGLPDCEGIYKAINAETALYLEGRYTYINRESDMGVAGLREAKMRYHPHHMVEVFSVRKEDLVPLV